MKKLILLLLLFASVVHSQNGGYGPALGGGSVSASTLFPTGNRVAPFGAYNFVLNGGANGDTRGLAPTGYVDSGSGTGDTITCTNCNFTASDVAVPAKVIFCGLPNNTVTGNTLARTTITGFTSATQITVAAGNPGKPCSFLVWGHPDDAACAAATTYLNNNLTGINNQTGGMQNSTATSTSARVYIPGGRGYLFGASGTCFHPSSGGGASGLVIEGDGHNVTWFFLDQQQGAFTGSVIFAVAGNIGDATLKGLTLWGDYVGPYANASGIAGFDILDDVYISSLGANSQSVCTGSPITSVVSGWANISHAYNDEIVASCGGIVGGNNQDSYGTITSNNAEFNLAVLNSTGGRTSTGSSGYRFIGGLIDECSGFTINSEIGCIIVQNSVDVAFDAVSMFGATGGCVSNCYAGIVDPTSVVTVNGKSYAGNFSGGGGWSIQNGGRLESSFTRFVGTASGVALNTHTNGIFVDNGGNSITDVGAAITATGFSETGNVVTVTSAAHNIPVGSSGQYIWVYGPCTAPIGFLGNFIVASVPSTTTITYNDAVSGLGTNQNGTGCQVVADQPSQLSGTGSYFKAGSDGLTNFTEGVVNLAASTIGNWVPTRNIFLTRITAANSAGTITCATPLVLSLSNGTTTQTLTLTSGQSTWDTGVIGSNAKIFASGITATLSQTAAAACATPPVNLNVSIQWQNFGFP